MPKKRSSQLGQRTNNNKCPRSRTHHTNGFKKMVGLSQTDKCRFCKTETESNSHLLSGCKKRLSEQLYTQQHNKVCKVIHWHICKNFNIPVPENSWKHELRAIIENKDVMLTYDLMIPLSMNIENKALRPDIVLRNKKERTALLIEISVPSDFCFNNAEIKKMTKYQELKNEITRSWKLMSVKIAPVIIGATGVIKKNLTEILVTIVGNITTNELQLEAVRGSMMILKRALGTKL